MHRVRNGVRHEATRHIANGIVESRPRLVRVISFCCTVLKPLRGALTANIHILLLSRRTRGARGVLLHEMQESMEAPSFVAVLLAYWQVVAVVASLA